MNQVCQALSGGEKVYSFLTFHPEEQNTQPFFSEVIELLPMHLIPSGIRMLIILAIHLIPHCKSCMASPESMEMSILRKTKTLHREGVWKWESICKPCTGKILP